MLLFGKIYVHRVTLALIAIIHVKGDAAWQGEGIVEVAHEDRTIQAIRCHISMEGEPGFLHAQVDLWRPNAYLWSGTDVGGHALETLHVLTTYHGNSFVLRNLLCPIDDGIARVLVVDHKLDELPYTR